MEVRAFFMSHVVGIQTCAWLTMNGSETCLLFLGIRSTSIDIDRVLHLEILRVLVKISLREEREKTFFTQ